MRITSLPATPLALPGGRTMSIATLRHDGWSKDDRLGGGFFV